MLLCIDIGNTNIMLGLYEGENSVPIGAWPPSTSACPTSSPSSCWHCSRHAGVAPAEIDGVALASGVPGLTQRWCEVCRRYLNQEPLVVRSDMKTGLTILYDNPSAVGADRVVDAVAAYTFYGGPLIIVDFGTATTFEAVTASGEYLGGAIAPGMGVAAEPWPSAPRACPPSTSPSRRRPSAATRSTPCSRASSMAMSAWSRAWSPASKPNWATMPKSSAPAALPRSCHRHRCARHDRALADAGWAAVVV